MKQEACDDLQAFIHLEFELQNKIDALVSLTGLPRKRVEELLEAQFFRFLVDRGHGTDIEGAEF